MELYASNEDKEYFEVQLDITQVEAKSVTECTTQFSIGVSRLICEYIHKWCPNKEDPKMLLEVVMDTVNAMVRDYYESGTYEEVADARYEKELYDFMEEIFQEYLKSQNTTESKFLNLFDGWDTIKFDISLNEGNISILITDKNGSQKFIMETFEIGLTENIEEIEKLTSFANIIATVLGDKLYGEESNPIRAAKNTEGFCDGGLIGLINNVTGEGLQE